MSSIQIIRLKSSLFYLHNKKGLGEHNITKALAFYPVGGSV